MNTTKPLIELIDYKFDIPAYQRGYRWEAQEVTELLDDLWNFSKDRASGEFYCLQPIVLRQKGEKNFEVLDGQQRLTTLFLLLTYLEDKRAEDNYGKEIFKLNYETRKECENFLQGRKFKHGFDDSNIDFYHICKAYETIDRWFKADAHKGAKGKLIPILMDDNSKGNRNVRFIHYIVPKDEVSPIDIFIRLNVGKIPLTDAELTKALLLQRDKYSVDDLKYIQMNLFQIANEWDNIEYTLQGDEFWYFLNNQSNDGRPTHIEFIFDLIAVKVNREKKYFATKPLRHSTFLILSEYLNDLIDNDGLSRIEAVNTIWKKVTEYFESFKDWFNNRTLYHYIGFIIANKGPQVIEQMMNTASELSKSGFERYLEREIGKIIKVEGKRVDTTGQGYDIGLSDLCYEHENQQTDDRPKISVILLLHNVFASLKADKEKSRFPFYLYKETKKNEKWSLEHIHAQNSDPIGNREGQNQWLDDHIKSFSDQNRPEHVLIIDELTTLRMSAEIKKEQFEAIVEKVSNEVARLSGISNQIKHRIDNLCLVDALTNSKLNCSVFDVKREIIKQAVVDGAYVPLCTRNIFLKAYTRYPKGNAYWTAEDRQGYLENVVESYEFFVSQLH